MTETNGVLCEEVYFSVCGVGHGWHRARVAEDSEECAW